LHIEKAKYRTNTTQNANVFEQIRKYFANDCTLCCQRLSDVYKVISKLLPLFCYKICRDKSFRIFLRWILIWQLTITSNFRASSHYFSVEKNLNFACAVIGKFTIDIKFYLSQWISSLRVKVGGCKSNLALKVASNIEVHFTFFNVPKVYISRGGTRRKMCPMQLVTMELVSYTTIMQL